MKFSDLVERLGVPARQVRYMISEGIIPEARQGGRYADPWGDEHISRGRRALALQEQGFTPASVKLLMQGGQTVPIAKVGPVALAVDPAADPADIDVEATLAEFASALRRYVQTHPETASEE